MIHHIQSLADLYSKTRGTTTTKAYLSELKESAKLSGRQFEDVLHEELSRISDSVTAKSVRDDSDPQMDPEEPCLPCGPAISPSKGIQTDLCSFPVTTSLRPVSCEFR